MRVFGFELTRARKKDYGPLSSEQYRLASEAGWFSIVREPYTGAWQSGMESRPESILTFAAAYKCIDRIASDIAKLRIKLVELDLDGIWTETSSPAFSPVLAKPNDYQNRIQFLRQWLVSKLTTGNTYVLKFRDARRVVIGLYVLDPRRVRPLVTPTGEVYYRLGRDDLSGVTADDTVVPASEIIHDLNSPLYHPLCGISPLSACGLAAMQGLRIQNNSERFFRNMSVPSGIITAPEEIPEAAAARIKVAWEEKFSGQNFGRVAVLGDGLEYKALQITAEDSQLIEQLKWTAENVCTAFGVPPYMIDVGPPPAYNNIEALNQRYYSQCLQMFIEEIELCLDEGLGLPSAQGHVYGTELDLDGLLRMDSATQIETLTKSVTGGIRSPNEARAKLDLKPVNGGDTPYLQQQNYSLAALAKRDAKDDPFAGKQAPAASVGDGAAPAEPTTKSVEGLGARLDEEIERLGIAA